ncbi:hypothetical protein BX667DRAFT_535971 [Coemansia mojavensis]|nr:hypothetical protein BX667DRAFT_535971 [Coemansia mojavensis]
MTTRHYNGVCFGATTRWVLSILAPVLNVYPPSITFYEDNRFKDIKEIPEEHIRAFFELAKIVKAKDSIPKNTKINATIFKPMQTTNGKKFSGVIDTGGVAVSIHKESDARKQAKLDKGQTLGAAQKAVNVRNAAMAVKAAPAKAKVVKRIADSAADYIPDAAKHATDVATYADKAVRIMKRKTAEPRNAAKWADKALEAAVAFEMIINLVLPVESLLAQTGLDKELITYTANAAAGSELSDDAAAVSKPPSPLLSLALKLREKTQMRREILKEIEASTTEDSQLLKYASNQQFKERQTKRFSSIRKKAKTKAVEEAGGRLAELPSRTLEITEFIEHLQARARESPILREFYEGHLAKHQHIAGIRDCPLHSKLRLSSYSNKEQADARLVRSLWDNFQDKPQCQGPALVYGDWSGSHRKRNEPIRGVGMRDILQCTVELGDKTGYCEWNQDLAAVSNFRTILQSIRESKGFPEQFKWGNRVNEAQSSRIIKQGKKKELASKI